MRALWAIRRVRRWVYVVSAVGVLLSGAELWLRALILGVAAAVAVHLYLVRHGLTVGQLFRGRRSDDY